MRMTLKSLPETEKVLRKEYSNFLGFKFKLVKKGGRWVIKSHMSDKAIKKVTRNLQEQINVIERAKDTKERVQEINKYNAMVMGIHNYYSLATEIYTDLRKINKGLRIRIHNRLLKDIENPKEGELNPESAIAKKYGES